MIAEDNISPIHEDEFSGSVYGDQNQLTVLGWCYRDKGGTKIYVVHCSICSLDSELYGNGLFKTFKMRLESGTIPCGCSKLRHWSESQYTTIVRRNVQEKGLIFEGWIDGFKRGGSLCSINCPEHGTIRPKKVTAVLSGNFGCALCAKRTDEEWLAIFEDTGSYPEGTKFQRSSKKTRRNSREYWDVLCSECKEECLTTAWSIVKGSLSCSCSVQRQKFAYILLLYSDGIPVAAKMGITMDVERRVKEINRYSTYDVELLGYWEFEDVGSCKSSERLAKRSVACGIITDQDVVDGHSETFYIRDIDKVVKIFEDYGGVRFKSSNGKSYNFDGE